MSDPMVKIAAALLAEAEREGRRRRKQAAFDFGQAASDVGNWAAAHPTAAGALGGAALGGVGGAVLGSRGKRDKSPWATGLTGALSGAAVGTGLGLGYKGIGGAAGLRNFADTHFGKKVVEENKRQLVDAPTGEQIVAKFTGAPGSEDMTGGQLAARGAARNIDPVGALAVAGGGVAGSTIGAAMDRGRARDARIGEFTSGAREVLKPYEGPKAQAPDAHVQTVQNLYNRAVAAKDPKSLLAELEQRRVAAVGDPIHNPRVGDAFSRGSAAAKAKLKAGPGVKVPWSSQTKGGLIGAGATMAAPFAWDFLKNLGPEIWPERGNGGTP